MIQKIGEYFRLARINAQIGLEAAAGLTQISIDEIQKLESGAAFPSLDSLYSLVNIYNLDPNEFITLLYENAVLKYSESSSGKSTKARD